MKSRSEDVSGPSHVGWYKFLLKTARALVLPFFRDHYQIHTEKFSGQIEEPCILVFNHCSHRDFFVTLDGFRYYGRYILTDSFLRKKALRIVLPMISDFIYRRRGLNGDNAVGSTLATLKGGVNVYFSPEGTVSQNGVTAYIRPRTGELIHEAGVGLAVYQISGSYFLNPTWADNNARGPIYGRVVAFHPKEELAAMTPDEINELIAKEIHLNSYDWIKEHRIRYERLNKAQCMERVVFTCPKCKAIHTMKSKEDTLFCTDCGYSVDVDDYGLFIGDEVIFDNLYDWDIWQKEELSSHLQEWIDDPDLVIAREENQIFQEMIGDKPRLIEEGVTFEITSKEVRVIGKESTVTVPFDDIISLFPSSKDCTGMTCLGKYYLLKSPYPTCNTRFRTIFKMLKSAKQ